MERVYHCLGAFEDYKSLPEIHVSPCRFASDRHLFGNSCVKCDPVLSSPESGSRRCTPATMLNINTTPITFTFEHLILRHRSVTVHEGILRTKASPCSATSVLSVSRHRPITFFARRGTPRRLITQPLQPGTLGIFLVLREQKMCVYSGY